MARETADEALARFRKDKRNRSYDEWRYLLELCGFQLRDESKKHSVFKCGTRTVTLQKPHGKGDKSLPLAAAATVLREIDAANLEKAKGREDVNDE